LKEVGDPSEKGEEGKAKKLYLLQPFQRCALKSKEILKDISKLCPILTLIFAGLRDTHLLPKPN
jgi:hypothetical protein